MGKKDSGPQWHSDTQLLGRVHNGARAAPVVFRKSDGSWRVVPADRYFKPNELNTWEHWNIKYLPRTLGVYQTYDSGNVNVLNEHLAMIANAKIDFVLVDQTNGLHVDENYIWERALKLCQRIKARQQAGATTPTYAVAVGLMQATHLPQTFEAEAGEIWNSFVNNPACGSYFHLDGKPLLVSYSDYRDRKAWEALPPGEKSNTRHFNVKFADGQVPNYTGCCRDNPPIPSGDYGLYYGWSMPSVHSRGGLSWVGVAS